jgi:nucleoid DNA-binding protein
MRVITLCVTAALQDGDTLTINGLGRFSLRHVEWYTTIGKIKNGPARVRVHPAADYPKFTPSPVLKRNIWKKRKPNYG